MGGGEGRPETCAHIFGLVVPKVTNYLCLPQQRLLVRLYSRRWRGSFAFGHSWPRVRSFPPSPTPPLFPSVLSLLFLSSFSLMSQRMQRRLLQGSSRCCHTTLSHGLQHVREGLSLSSGVCVEVVAGSKSLIQQ